MSSAQSKAGRKVVVVMPARNAARTLRHTVDAIPPEWVDEIILVDDKSTDDAVELARSDDRLHVVWDPHNVGYGGNQKTCYLEGLQHDADVVVMLHPDGQYEPSLIPQMVHPILKGREDMVSARASSATRWRAACRAGSTPPTGRWRRSRTRSSARTSPSSTPATAPTRGTCCSRCRACATRSTFSFDSELLMQAVHFGFRIEEVPCLTHLRRRRVLGEPAAGHRLRDQDALGGGAASASPRRSFALEEVHVVSLVTGERVVTAEGGFNPTYQRHVAAYRLCALVLPEGRVLDLGCGIGHSFHALAPRESVGVDRSAQALAGQQRETLVADMRPLPLPESSFASMLSLQSIEHVPDPEHVLAIVRVLEPGGTAVLVMPYRLEFARQDEIIDPYHYVEFDPDELRTLCARFFADVYLLGLFGSARWRELVDEKDRRLHRLLRMNPLGLRRLVPRRGRQLVYDWLLTRHPRTRPDPRAGGIGSEDFELRADDVERAFDLIAVCRQPRK